jgi:heptosyltransferase-2
VPRDREHLSENYLRLGRAVLSALKITAPAPGGHHKNAIGKGRADAPESSERPAARILSDDTRRSTELLSSCGIDDGDYVVVVPGAAFGPAKAWPRERFREMCKQLSGRVPVLLTGGAGDAGLCEWIGRDVSGVFNLAGKTTMGEFFALMSGAKVVVANDSGSPHAAAALGVRVVTLFGSTSPTWTAPLGTHVDVVREPVHCSPCFRRTCPTELECFGGIEPNDVAGRVLRVACPNDVVGLKTE